MTHSLRFLPDVDKIVVMKDGEISEMGSYKELVESEGEFAQLIANYVPEEQNVEEEEIQEEQKIIDSQKEEVQM